MASATERLVATINKLYSRVAKLEAREYPVPTINAGNISSGSNRSGRVLLADGVGGATWEHPGRACREVLVGETLVIATADSLVIVDYFVVMGNLQLDGDMVVI